MGREPSKSWDYQMGTEAYDYSRPLQPRPTREEEPFKQPKQQPKIKRAPYSIRIIMSGIFIAVVSAMFVHTTVSMAIKQNTLTNKTQELRDIRSAINDVEATMAATLNLDYIREAAESELGMAEPLPHQVRYIEMPRESHTLYNE